MPLKLAGSVTYWARLSLSTAPCSKFRAALERAGTLERGLVYQALQRAAQGIRGRAEDVPAGGV